MPQISMSEARENLPEIVNKAVYKKQRTIVSRRGKAIAAIVPLEDLELLEEIEHQLDLKEIRKRLKKADKEGFMSKEQLLKKLR